MNSAVRSEEMIIGITPYGEPDAGLTVAVGRAGGLGVLDLGAGDRRSREALAQLQRTASGRFGVRVDAHCRLTPADLAPDGPHTVVLAVAAAAGESGAAWTIAALAAPSAAAGSAS